MIRNNQLPAPPLAPPKPRKEVVHWSQQIQETVASASHEESLSVILRGGADNGQFCYVGDVSHEKISYHGEKLYLDDILLEIQGQKVSGYTLRDATIWLKQVSQNGAPVMIKTVRPGALPKDLRQFLNARFQKGSVDHDLQQTIRDNLYMRTVPCTTRQPRAGEMHGMDYNFLSVDEFMELEKRGELLESGLYDGNHYGTPKPPKEPQAPIIRRTNSTGHVSAMNSGGSDPRRKRTRSTSNSDNRQSPVPPGLGEDNLPIFTRKKSLERAHSASSLGPLPSNWEMAYTEDGHPYFIDHNTETTHWLDPRLATLQKQAALECEDDELPFGWEKVEDPHYGTYYIDHVNRKTQYDNPVAQAKKTMDHGGGEVNGAGTYPRPQRPGDAAKRSVSDSNMNGPVPAPASRGGEGTKPFFTKNPEELRGEFIRTSLVKSTRGFGFTIIGGDHIDEEFLQIKNVVPNGPAFVNGKLKTGDVIVYVNERCVLGYTHQDVVTLFQTITPGETVSLEVCRGYSLPFDPDDPNTEIVTTVAVSMPQGLPTSNTPSSSGVHNNADMLNTSQRSLKSLPDLAKSAAVGNQNTSFSQHSMPGELGGGDDTPDVVNLLANKPEYFSINIVRGPMGFGFTIADSPYGQKVKQILDRPRCKNLQEGDLLHVINDVSVREMTHSQVVQVLKECPIGVETTIVIQRGGIPLKGRKTVKSSKSFEDRSQQNDSSFSSQPGAYFFTGQEGQHPNGERALVHSLASASAPSGPRPREEQGSEVEKEESATAETGDDVDGREQHHGRGHLGDGPPSRPKTPQQGGAERPKTPSNSEPRPKTPTRSHGMGVGGKPPLGSRYPGYDGQPSPGGRHPAEMGFRRGDFDNGPEYPPPPGVGHDPAYPRGGNMDHVSRPPPAPRPDAYRYDFGGRGEPRSRPDFRGNPGAYGAGYPRSNFTMHMFGDRRGGPGMGGGEGDWGEKYDVKPGQFRSRTPGPDLMARGGAGPDHRTEPHRPKTPTAQDMRSKTPLPGHSADYKASGRFTPNPAWEYGRSYRQEPPSRPRPPHDFGSPGPVRRFDVADSNAFHERGGGYPGDFVSRHPHPLAPPSPGAGLGRGGPRQSTSFETEEPTPSNITRVPRRPPYPGVPAFPPPGPHSPRGLGRLEREDVQYMEMTVVLHRQESGFGFRIIGGTEEGSQVSVGHIVAGGVADVDGRLRTGDEITYVDGCCVVNSSHRRVVELMGSAAQNGRVTLSVRRRISPYQDFPQGVPSHNPSFPYDVKVTRRESEGFGFVIISSVTKSGSTLGEFIDLEERGLGSGFAGLDSGASRGSVVPWIGRILENSPAERCGKLHVGDRILAVNGVDIIHMHHEDIVNLIKESGYSVTLTIGPPPDDASSTTSTSQRSSAGSMINAMAYPAVSESEMMRRPEHPSHPHPSRDRALMGAPPEMSQGRMLNHQPVEENVILLVELHRGTRGFGFSIRGGREFNNMPLYVLRIADDGAAGLDGRLKIGDQILEINGIKTTEMTHAEAINIIQSGGNSVSLLIKKTGKPPPSLDPTPSPVSRYPNGPIGHSSPHMARRQMQMEREDYFHNYPHERTVPNY